MSWKRRGFSLSPFLLFLSFFLFLFFFFYLSPFSSTIEYLHLGHQEQACLEGMYTPASSSFHLSSTNGSRESWGLAGLSIHCQPTQALHQLGFSRWFLTISANGAHCTQVPQSKGVGPCGMWAVSTEGPCCHLSCWSSLPQWFICWPRNGLYSPCCLCHVCPWEKTTQKAENLKNKERKGEKREEKCLLNTWRSGERKCFSFQFKCMFPRFPFSYISPHWALNVCTVLFLFLCFLFLLGPDVLVHCSTKQRGTQQRSPSIILWSSPWALSALPKIIAWKRLLQAMFGSSSLAPPCHGFIVHL